MPMLAFSCLSTISPASPQKDSESRLLLTHVEISRWAATSSGHNNYYRRKRKKSLLFKKQKCLLREEVRDRWLGSNKGL